MIKRTACNKVGICSVVVATSLIGWCVAGVWWFCSLMIGWSTVVLLVDDWLEHGGLLVDWLEHGGLLVDDWLKLGCLLVQQNQQLTF